MSSALHEAGPILVFSRDAARAVDDAAIHRYGIPGIVLMENAAREAAAILLEHLAGARDGDQPSPAREAMIVCGSGNNGGDGYAMARHLHNAGVAVRVRFIGTPRDGSDAELNRGICQRMNIQMKPFDPVEKQPQSCAVVDAIFGTGLDRPLEGLAAEAIEWINDADRPTLAVDVPSGLDCDTGRVLGRAVRATLTASFLGWKRAFLVESSRRFAGKIVIASIGAPRELLTEFGEPLVI